VAFLKPQCFLIHDRPVILSLLILVSHHITAKLIEGLCHLESLSLCVSLLFPRILRFFDALNLLHSYELLIVVQIDRFWKSEELLSLQQRRCKEFDL
jgi:hypothetical protein